MKYPESLSLSYYCPTNTLLSQPINTKLTTCEQCLKPVFLSAVGSYVNLTLKDPLIGRLHTIFTLTTNLTIKKLKDFILDLLTSILLLFDTPSLDALYLEVPGFVAGAYYHSNLVKVRSFSTSLRSRLSWVRAIRLLGGEMVLGEK